MKIWWKKFKLSLNDNMRYSRTIREITGWVFYLRGITNGNAEYRGARLTRALGIAESALLKQRSTQALHVKPGIDQAADIWSRLVRLNPRYAHLLNQYPHLTRSMVLKAPGEQGEKGVFLMTFEYNWVRLLLGLSDEQFAWIEQHYELIFSTSWSSTDYAVLALVLSKTRNTVFVQSCNYGEIATIEQFHPRIKCLPTLPCDWINPNLFIPKPVSTREIDILMVANWAQFKRHWELFQALAKMPASLNVTLIGQPEAGATTETIRALAAQFNVPQRLQILESIPIEEVTRHQCNAKVALIMTRREGCCVAAVEALFAGCALAMRDDAHVGPLAYINQDTGARLRPGKIAEDLQALLARVENLTPRTWALAQVAGSVSWQKVNAFFAEVSKAEGKPWLTDIILPQWHPHPTFSNLADQERMRPAYDALVARAPHVFAPDLITDSWR